MSQNIIIIITHSDYATGPVVDNMIILLTCYDISSPKRATQMPKDINHNLEQDN